MLRRNWRGVWRRAPRGGPGTDWLSDWLTHCPDGGGLGNTVVREQNQDWRGHRCQLLLRRAAGAQTLWPAGRLAKTHRRGSHQRAHVHQPHVSGQPFYSSAAARMALPSSVATASPTGTAHTCSMRTTALGRLALACLPMDHGRPQAAEQRTWRERDGSSV